MVELGPLESDPVFLIFYRFFVYFAQAMKETQDA